MVHVGRQGKAKQRRRRFQANTPQKRGVVRQDAGDGGPRCTYMRVGCIAGRFETDDGCILRHKNKKTHERCLQNGRVSVSQTPQRSLQTMTMETHRLTSQHAASLPYPHPFPASHLLFASQLAYLSDELGLYPKVVNLLPRRHEHCRRAGNRLKRDGIHEPYSSTI